MEQKEKNDRKKPLDSYIKYSALGFQMLGSILISAFIGYKLDQHFETGQPYITLGLMLFGVAGSIYIAIKGLSDK